MEAFKFEAALKRLEQIVSDLEGGELALDEALKKYEEGVRLSRECTKKLQQAEKKIEILTKGLDGSFSLSAFEKDLAVEEENETTSRPKPSRASSKKTAPPSKPGEDLFETD